MIVIIIILVVISNLIKKREAFVHFSFGVCVAWAGAALHLYDMIRDRS